MCGVCGCSFESSAKAIDFQRSRYDEIPMHRYIPNGKSSPSGQDIRTISLEHKILEANNAIARRNRELFDNRGVHALNFMSSPGSGKTTILEKTIQSLGTQLDFQVIEGDQATENDARRIRACGCEVIQINTGKSCHLEAGMIEKAMARLEIRRNSYLMIENVGNLVCPALFDLGEHARIIIASVTEGEDKPIKYPHMFQAADLVLLNKMDLLPYIEFSYGAFEKYMHEVNPHARIMKLSARSGEGLDDWHQWLLGRRHASESHGF